MLLLILIVELYRILNSIKKNLNKEHHKMLLYYNVRDVRYTVSAIEYYTINIILLYFIRYYMSVALFFFLKFSGTSLGGCRNRAYKLGTSICPPST